MPSLRDSLIYRMLAQGLRPGLFMFRPCEAEIVGLETLSYTAM